MEKILFKTLLINLHTPSNTDFFEGSGRTQPLNLAFLAAYLKSHRFPVEILDADLLSLSPSKAAHYIQKSGPDIVGIGSVTANFPQAVKLAQKIKKLKKKPFVIIGGPHITAVPKDIKTFPFFDFAVLGEGEETLLELVKNLSQGKRNLRSIKGIAYCQGKKLVITSARPYIENLNRLPFPAYDLLPPLSSYNPSPGMYRKLPVAFILTSRGCPHRCTFCCRTVFGNFWRARSAQKVVEEIELLVKKFGAKEIRFCDDNFTHDEKRVLDICQGLIKRKIKISWGCAARADFITPRMLQALKKAGCWQVGYGIESGNPQVLKMTQKGLTLQTIQKAIHLTRKYGMEARGFFILGLPGDTEDSMQDTINFAKDLKLDVANFYITIPFPGTEIAQKADRFGKINYKNLDSYLNQTTKSPPFIPRGLTQKQLLAYYKKANREFYLRPSYLLGKLLRIRAWPLLRAYPEALISIARKVLK